MNFILVFIYKLVVIAIIAILAAMLLPALGKAREKARAISCTSKLKSLAEYDVMYANDNEDWLIPNVGGANDGRPWALLLSDLKIISVGDGILYCPCIAPGNKGGVKALNADANAWSWYPYGMRFNDGGTNAKFRLTSEINSEISGGTRMHTPSNFVRFADSLNAGSTTPCSTQTIHPRGNPETKASNYKASVRHGGKGNQAFADGSARSSSRNELVENYGFIDVQISDN